MADSYRRKFIDEKRSNGDAYLFHHLEPGGQEADIDSLKESVEELIRKIDVDTFWISTEGKNLRFRVLGEMMALILSGDWEYV